MGIQWWKLYRTEWFVHGRRADADRSGASLRHDDWRDSSVSGDVVRLWWWRGHWLQASSQHIVISLCLSVSQSHISNNNTNTHTSNGLLPGTTWVSRYRKGKTNLDFTEARDSEWQWHPLGSMQVCTSLQTDNYASNTPLSFLQALPAAQPTASKH